MVSPKLSHKAKPKDQKWPCRRGLKHGKRWSPGMVPAAELRMGIEIEKEHTKSPRIACRIAIDHLSENLHYYTKLKKAKL